MKKLHLKHEIFCTHLKTVKFHNFWVQKFGFQVQKPPKHGAKTGAKTVKIFTVLHLPGPTKAPKGANDWGIKGRTIGESKGERLGSKRANDWGVKKESKIKLRIDSDPNFPNLNSIRRSRCPGSDAISLRSRFSVARERLVVILSAPQASYPRRGL